MKAGAGARAVAAAIVRSVTSGDDEDSEQLRAADHILGSLQDELIRLIGPTGFHALLDRSFHRAAAQQGLAVRTRPPSTPADYMRSFHDNMRSVPPNDLHDALIAVLAELLSLLTRLIGADITAGLVHRTWPDAAPWLTAAHLEDADG